MRQPCEIIRNIFLIGSSDISHRFDCCVYLLDLGQLVIIDSGAGSSFQKLAGNIERLGLDPGKIKAVLATHAHIDHIGSLHAFREKYKTQIIAHELDADAIESGIGTAAEAYDVNYSPCTVDIRVEGDKQALVFDEHTLNIVHIPGHTPGSIAAYIDIDDKRVLFGQDIHGPYIPEWGADRKLAAVSLKKLIDLKADILCEGHFGVYQPAEEVRRYIEYYMDTL